MACSVAEGSIYIAGADKDIRSAEDGERLEKALSDARVNHRCEIYPARCTDEATVTADAASA
jgi:carboxymethylenebutenolidase